MSKLHWTFQGTLIQRNDKQSKNGKNFSELVLDVTGAKYPSICVCTYWGDLAPDVATGAEVYADGYMNGREYNQKFYAGLRAANVRLVSNAVRPDTKPDKPDSNPDVPKAVADQYQDSMPF